MGQTVDRQVIASGGIIYQTPNFTITSTFGETFINTLDSNGLILTQGFQQPIQYSCAFALYSGLDTIATCDTAYTLDAGAGYTSYQWGNGATTQTINITNSGWYKCTITLGLCTSIDSVYLRLVNAIATSNTPLCEGQTLNLTANGAFTYSWSGPNGFTSNLQNPIINNISTNNNGTYTLIVSSGTGCSDTTTLSVSVLANNPVTVTSNGPLCVGQTLNLTSNNGASYAWTGPNGFTSTLQSPIINNVALANAGNYAVIITNSNGCTNSASLTVSINPNTPVTASSNSPICEGSALNLTSSTGSQYIWSGPNGFTSTAQNPVISSTALQNSGIYSVTVTNACGTTTVSINAIVNASPIALIATTDTVLCENDTLYLVGSGTGTFLWNGPSGYSSNQQNNTLTNLTSSYTGYYNLVVTNSQGCSDTASVFVKTGESDCFFIPSVFTPNGDGINDTWVIEGLSEFPNCIVKVFNRWGQLLFDNTGYSQPWDGVYDGNPCPIADYYYIIDLGNGNKSFTGTVTIKR